MISCRRLFHVTMGGLFANGLRKNVKPLADLILPGRQERSVLRFEFARHCAWHEAVNKLLRRDVAVAGKLGVRFIGYSPLEHERLIESMELSRPVKLEPRAVFTE